MNSTFEYCWDSSVASATISLEVSMLTHRPSGYIDAAHLTVYPLPHPMSR